jgi:hypothetical protein
MSLRHPHDLLGYPICLLLIRVAGLVHSQTGLHTLWRIRMYPHATEVIPKSWLHKGARLCIQRLTG